MYFVPPLGSRIIVEDWLKECKVLSQYMTTKKHYLLHTAGNCTYELAAIVTAFTEHMKGKAKPNPSKGVVVGVSIQSQSYP